MSHNSIPLSDNDIRPDRQKQNLMAASKVIKKAHQPNQDVSRYYQCAGKGCENEGKIMLTILYLKRIGHFCEACAEELLRFGLAVRREMV